MAKIKEGYFTKKRTTSIKIDLKAEGDVRVKQDLYGTQMISIKQKKGNVYAELAVDVICWGLVKDGIFTIFIRCKKKPLYSVYDLRVSFEDYNENKYTYDIIFNYVP